MNSKNKPTFTLAEIAAKVGGTIDGDDSVLISGVAPIESAGQGAITFVANKRYARFLETTGASAVVLDMATEHATKPVLRHKNPYFAFARIVDLFHPNERRLVPGCHPTTIIENDVRIADTAGIGPFCHISEDSSIGEDSQLLSSVYVGKHVTIGNNCLIYPGVIILDNTTIGNNVIIHASTVIGSDGFGFAESDTGLKKVKQVGWVEIADDVEIGSNCSIDRGALGPTKIGRGTKIDNLVQIAHNVEIGEHSIIVAQVGISGSTKIGNGVILAGQVGLVGHIEIGDGVKIGAQSGVNKSVPPGKMLFGYPAREIMLAKRIEAALTRLPDLLTRVRKLEKKLDSESGK